MKKIVILLMFIKVLVASTLEVSDGNVTVTIGKSERLLPQSTKIELDKNVTVCYVSGEGKILIDDMSRSSISKDKCYTTEKEKKFDIKKIIADYVKNTFVRLFKESNDKSVWTLFRGGKNEKFSGVVTLKAKEEHLVISNNQWSSYPITLTIYDIQNREVKSVIKYVNDYEDMMIFSLSRKDLRTGGYIKVHDNDGDEYMNVRVELK